MPLQLAWPDKSLPLAERHEQLSRTTQAMWQLLKSKLDTGDDELQQALRLIELSSPAVAPRLYDCSVCGHPMRSTARNCLYCGTVPGVKSETPRIANILGVWRTHQ
jgi:rubrerythrin